uniref:SWIM-type domain-containing protein n=2 Tax=Clytia hemisphaerica TaxID=252671 RepID=A0A7M5WQG0_9CNID
MLDLYNDSDVKGPPSKRRKCVFDKKKRVVVDTPYICNHLGIDEEEVLELSKNISSIATQKNKDEKLYLHYVEKLFSSGCLNWRVLKAPSLQIILMNNIDPMTGEFKDKDFVHVTIKGTTTGPIITCSCAVFDLLQSTVNEEDVNGSVGFRGLKCCHSRLAEDLLVLKPMNFVPNELEETSIGRHYFNADSISKAEESVNMPILQLPGKINVFRFAVVIENNEAELITICRNKKGHNTITCHNSYCRSKISKERYLDTFQKSDNLCPHLEFLRSSFDVTTLRFTEGVQDEDENENENENNNDNDMECDDFVSDAEPIEWEKVFDEDTGRWKFHEKAPSVWRVSDKRDEIYQENIKRRAIQILLGQEIKLIPSKNGNCGCEGGWYNEENPDGHIMPRGETIVYSTMGAAKGRLYERACMGGSCFRDYDGSEDSLFRSSTTVACGYEIGWEFVDSVM